MKPGDFQNLWRRLIFSLSAMLIFGFFLIGGKALCDATSDPDSCEIQREDITFLSAINSHGNLHNPIQPPLKADRPAQESAEETELKDGDGKDWGDLFSNPAFEYQVLKSTRIARFAQVSRSNKNRSAVSLIVLHHCWKSFLS